MRSSKMSLKSKKYQILFFGQFLLATQHASVINEGPMHRSLSKMTKTFAELRGAAAPFYGGKTEGCKFDINKCRQTFMKLY